MAKKINKKIKKTAVLANQDNFQTEASIPIKSKTQTPNKKRSGLLLATKDKKDKNNKKLEKISVHVGREIKSNFLLNLKNPGNFLSHQSEIIEINSLPLVKSNLLVKPLRFFPKTGKKIGVNFIINPTSSHLALELSIVKLFSLILIPLKKINLWLRRKKVESTKFDNDQASDSDIEDIFAPPMSFTFFGLNVPYNWQKKIAIFILFVVILISPLQALTYFQGMSETKDRVLLMTSNAIDDLMAGQNAVLQFDLPKASQNFNQAKNNFSLARNEINQLSILTGEILKLLPGQNQSVNLGVSLLKSGEIISETGQILVDGANKFLEVDSVADYYQKLVLFQNDIRQAITKFNEAKIDIEKIKISDLPAGHEEDFKKVLNYLPQIDDGLTTLYEINLTLLKILGHQQWQRYLLIFLNNNELRGGGGFMGSFALLDIDQGEIKKLDIPAGGTYDVQGALVPKVISPQPLHLINPRWEFQDANWWPDFPTSAKKIEWFYQKANGPSVNGVITLTSTLMEGLLEIFGPIPMPEYGREISAQNFVMETQKIVELEYDRKENRPKQFIADLAPKLLEKIFKADKNQLKKLFTLLVEGLNQRQLMVYFNESRVQKVIKDFGWSGELRKSDGDYLAVIHSNIAGGKTDGVIKETIQHLAEVQSDGSIINTVKLIRQHTGIRGENIFTGVQNNSYVRFYVPAGSILLAARGFKSPPAKLFEDPGEDLTPDLDLISIESKHEISPFANTEIYQENNKTVFANWLLLKPGETQEAEIKYQLPFKLALDGQNTFYYSLLAQKQLGSVGSEFTSQLKLNNQLKPLALFPATLSANQTNLNFIGQLSTDQFYGVILTNSE